MQHAALREALPDKRAVIPDHPSELFQRVPHAKLTLSARLSPPRSVDEAQEGSPLSGQRSPSDHDDDPVTRPLPHKLKEIVSIASDDDHVVTEA